MQNFFRAHTPLALLCPELAGNPRASADFFRWADAQGGRGPSGVERERSAKIKSKIKKTYFEN